MCAGTAGLEARLVPAGVWKSKGGAWLRSKDVVASCATEFRSWSLVGKWMADAAEDTIYPLEFLVEGVPVSGQSSGLRKAKWIEKVQTAAKARQLATVDLTFLDDRPLAVTVYFFCLQPMQGDVDNILKPILDAMNCVAYLDDKVVERVVAQRFGPDFAPIVDVDGVTEQFAAALATAPPIVYIRVDDDLQWRRLS